MNSRINALIVETSGGCNLKCEMCPTTSYTTGKSLVADDIFEKILDVIRKQSVEEIDLTGWGEPLLDPKLEERIARIKLLESEMCK